MPPEEKIKIHKTQLTHGYERNRTIFSPLSLPQELLLDIDLKKKDGQLCVLLTDMYSLSGTVSSQNLKFKVRYTNQFLIVTMPKIKWYEVN